MSQTIIPMPEKYQVHTDFPLHPLQDWMDVEILPKVSVSSTNLFFSTSSNGSNFTLRSNFSDSYIDPVTPQTSCLPHPPQPQYWTIKFGVTSHTPSSYPQLYNLPVCSLLLQVTFLILWFEQSATNIFPAVSTDSEWLIEHCSGAHTI